MTRNTLGIGLLALLTCGLILLTGPRPLKAVDLPAEPQVLSGSIQRSNTPNSFTAIGQLAPRQILSLASQVTGEIVWVNPNLVPGGELKEGEVLFKILKRDFEIVVARAKANLKKAHARLEIEKGRSEIARIEWEAWQETSGSDLSSPLALRIPQQAEVQAEIEELQTTLDNALLNLRRTEITAPFASTVIEASTAKGQIIGAGEQTALLFPIDYGYADINIPPQRLGELDSGIRAIQLRPAFSLDASAVDGKLDYVIRNLTPDTRLATARIRVAAPLENRAWTFGMHLEAKLYSVSERAVAHIPTDLVTGGNLVWILRDGQAWRHQVIPIEQKGDVIVVEDTFDSNDQLILEQPIGIFEGATVVSREISGV